MTNDEVKQAVEEYFNEMLAKDADYLDHITDSWIYDAEDWFFDRVEKEGIKIFTNNTDYKYTKKIKELAGIFWGIALKRKEELYDEKYGERDAKLHLHYIIGEVFNLKGEFEKYKHHFKTFPTYDNVVSTDFENLLEHLKLLNDIESGKIESLKKGK